MEDLDLNKFIKYCLGYVQLTRQRAFAVQQKSAVEFPKKYFTLQGLLNGVEDGELGEVIDLPLFYKLDPKEVKKDDKEEYERQKALAAKIEDVYNKFRNDPFTKQVVFSFGYFEIEIPLDIEEDELVAVDNGEEAPVKQVKIDRYPLFSILVKIEKEEGGKYVIYSVDQDVQINIGVLEPILGENLYYQLLADIGKKEIDGLFSLPIKDTKIFTDVWHKIKEVLKLTEAKFDEDSFGLEEMRIAIAPRANYFLAEDLQKLSKIEKEAMEHTSLSGWTSNEGISETSAVPEEKELFFPFLYDKYKLKVLSVINNKGAIVQGPPGTGKSETIANLLCHLAAQGKRVLFVSQKAQALKVVKDKLRKLDVKYLFGYIPNPSSAQLGEDDEADGISPQLAGLSAHIESMGYKLYPRKSGIARHGSISADDAGSVGDSSAIKTGLRNDFNQAIEAQRKAWAFDAELKSLKAYDLVIDNFTAFTAEFEEGVYAEINDLKGQMESARKSVQAHKNDARRGEFDLLFKEIDLGEKSFATPIAAFKADVARTGFDKHSQVLRSLNNFARNFRLAGVRNQLPREVRDYLDAHLSTDISRNDARKLLEDLHSYFQYHENLIILSRAKSKLGSCLQLVGLKDEEFEAINTLIVQTGEMVSAVKEKIIRTRALRKDLRELGRLNVNPNDVTRNIQDADKERRERVALYLQNIVNRNIISKMAQGPTIRQIVARLAKAFGKSKRAFKTFDKLRKDPDNFNAIMELIPIWIMELDDASRIIPLEPGSFDYVILDEASQCNVAYTLPVMYRAKKALFVGDSEQMRDSTVMFKSNRSFDELARKYGVPEEMQIKASQATVQSVLDIAAMRGFISVPLRYHYRSPNELIGFSNQYFYKPKAKELIALNNNYLTFKDTNRVMLVHEITRDLSKEISDNANLAEAEAILELFKELREDDRYKDKSVGVLTFFNAQAALLREMFEGAGFKEDEDNFKISIIEGIQGDEKDIVIYSFVIRRADQKKRYLPLTGEGGDIRGDINRGRVNVAFSRAKLQVHCFVSMPVAEIPEGIWIKKYIEYVQKHGEIDFYATDLRKFDSFFEEDFYAFIRKGLKRDYQIRNQVESCGFKLDFVLSNSRTGKQLAIECDGPTHFENEIDEEYGIYVENDEERQRVLESAGWTFYRVKYLDWLDEEFDRKAILKDIIGLLGA